MGHLTASKIQLLYVGNEALLSRATAELLKSAGYRVRTTNPLHADHTLREDHFGVIILCATLSSEEAQQVVETAMEAQPETPILSVHLGLLGDVPNSRSTIIVDALKGPDALVSAVHTAARASKPITSQAG